MVVCICVWLCLWLCVGAYGCVSLYVCRRVMCVIRRSACIDVCVRRQACLVLLIIFVIKYVEMCAKERIQARQYVYSFVCGWKGKKSMLGIICDIIILQTCIC